MGWRKVGGEMARTAEVHAEGAYGLAFSSTTPSTKWLYQTVAVDGGAYYELRAQGWKSDPGAAGVFLRLSWYESDDGSGEAIASVDSTEALEADWPGFRPLTTGPAQAPAEARTVKVRLMLRPASGAAASAYFDAASFVRTGPPSGPTAAPRDAAAVEPVANPEQEPIATASAVLAAASTPQGLANVRAVPRQEPRSPAGGGRSYGWLALLAAGVPAAALVFAAGYETGRRLAGKDEGRL